MNKPNLFFSAILKDGTERHFSLYDNNFSFEYGIGDVVRTTSENSLSASIRIEGIDNLIEVEKFIFNNYKELANAEEKIDQFNFEIYREDNSSSNQRFNFTQGSFKNFSIYYTNNSFGENRFLLSFELVIPEENNEENFKGFLING